MCCKQVSLIRLRNQNLQSHNLGTLIDLVKMITIYHLFSKLKYTCQYTYGLHVSQTHTHTCHHVHCHHIVCMSLTHSPVNMLHTLSSHCMYTYSLYMSLHVCVMSPPVNMHTVIMLHVHVLIVHVITCVCYHTH